MRFVLFGLFALCLSVDAKYYEYNQKDNPVQVAMTSTGRDDQERTVYLFAVIFPHHKNAKEQTEISNKTAKYFEAIKADGDELGLLVPAQFSGSNDPYNVSPQNVRVNRNGAYQAINKDWYGIECEIAKFLVLHSKRYVTWRVNALFKGDSNRPYAYHLQVEFFDGRKKLKWIDIHIRNPLKKQDNTHWNCNGCSSYRLPHCLRSYH